MILKWSQSDMKEVSIYYASKNLDPIFSFSETVINIPVAWRLFAFFAVSKRCRKSKLLKIKQTVLVGFFQNLQGQN